MSRPRSETSETIPRPTSRARAPRKKKRKQAKEKNTRKKIKKKKKNRSARPTAIWKTTPLFDRPLTDYGNAERLVAWHGEDLRFSKAFGWQVWDGRRWLRDETEEIVRRAKRTIRAMRKQVREFPGDPKTFLDHVNASERVERVNAMIKLAQSEPRIAVPANVFDRDPWLLNVENGTIELRTGVLREHRREDLITKLAPVAYDVNATCPRWDRFLIEVQPEFETRAYLSRLAGYATTAVIREHVLPVFYGRGRNGKGVYTNTLQHVLGDYATTIPVELLMAKQNDAHPTERMTLLGCRLAVASETEQNRQLATAMVKQLTGGDPITGRYMRRDYVTFQPTHKLMLATNNRPVIRETKDAIWDRVHLIPWAARFVGKQQDKTLGDKLKAEASGILQRLVEGCLEWQRIGLDPPPAVVAATAQYRVDMDAIGDFIAERCFLEPDARVSRAELRNSYEAWCMEVGEKFPLGAKAFAEALRERELVEVPSLRVPGRKTPVRGWQGIRLRTPADDPVDTYARVDADPGIPRRKGASEEETPGKVSTSDYVTTTPSGESPTDGARSAEDPDREVVDL
jgi:putative DNA primase/helicase